MARIQGGNAAVRMFSAAGARAVTGAGPCRLEVHGGTLAAAGGGSVHPDDDVAVKELLATAAVHGQVQPLLVRWLTMTGEQRYFELVAEPGRSDDAQVVVHGWDVTAHVEHQEVLEHLALHDPLTGLANRILFEERVRDELRRRGRTGQDVAVLYADLDGFKAVNDTWGHAAGDLLLATLADRLRDCLRPGDILARLGGDEFAVCCPDLSGAEDALAVAHRVVDEVTSPVMVGSTFVRVSVGVGVALAVDDEPTDGARLIARADLAMYAAKHAGRARVTLAPPPVSGREVG